MLNKLKEHNIWTIDGTFSITPNDYYQLYTIGFLKENHCYPVVYALLKDKSSTTYKFLFNFIKNKIGTFQPTIVKTDFEFAAFTAFKEVFENCQISGCHFHLGQSIFRKVTTLGPKSVYETDSNVKKFVRSL